MDENKTISKRKFVYLNILFACLTAIIALTLPALIVKHLGILRANPLYQHLLQSSLIGLVVVLGIWFLRSKVDKGTPVSIGLAKPSKAIIQILFGFGLIAVPLILTILLSQIFGWGEISLNISNGILITFIIGLISTFFTDALTEELIFRGYIFSNLKERFNVWISSLITLLLFVLVPIVILSIQKVIEIEGFLTITGSYVITLIFFGAFVQYLRVLTKSIWVGVGFHWFFVHMNQLMGITDDKLIQFSETSNQLPIQITLIILILIVFISLFIFPFIRRVKRKRR
jgi:hypothetical protein